MPRALQINGADTSAYGAVKLPTSAVDDEAMDANYPAGITKTKHLHKVETNFGQLIGDTPTTKEVLVYRANTAAVVKNFRALLNVDGSSTSIAYDLKKNGTTILSAAVTLTHSTGDRVAVGGTVNSPNLVAGDILSISQAVSSSTGAQGPMALVEVEENFS